MRLRRSTPISRWRAICATRASPSSTGSTPTRYLYITRAMDYFDLAADYGGVLANAFRGTQTRFCLMSFTTDWLFPTPESRAIVQALNAARANVSFVEIETDKGHDAFLLDEPEMFATLRGFLDRLRRASRVDASGTRLRRQRRPGSRWPRRRPRRSLRPANCAATCG